MPPMDGRPREEAGRLLGIPLPPVRRLGIVDSHFLFVHPQSVGGSYFQRFPNSTGLTRPTHFPNRFGFFCPYTKDSKIYGIVPEPCSMNGQLATASTERLTATSRSTVIALGGALVEFSLTH